MNCKLCGTGLPDKPAGRGRPQIFCNAICREAYYKQNVTLKIKATIEESLPTSVRKTDTPLNVVRYTRQPDGTFLKTGRLRERKVRLRRFINGEWIEGLCDLGRARVEHMLDAEIRDGAKYLPADIYEFSPVESTLTDEDRERLRGLNNDV